MLKLVKQSKVVQGALFLALAVSGNVAMAAKTGAEYKSMAEMVQNWTQGYLGMALALTAFLIGLAVGIMKQTIMPAIVGIGVALAATLGPNIILSMFTAII